MVVERVINHIVIVINMTDRLLVAERVLVLLLSISI